MVKTYCTNCSKKCVGDVLKVGEKYFHLKCFQCKDCNSCLDTGGFFFRNGDYYCPKDYTKRFSNKCFICSNLIESDVVSALNNHFHRNCFKCSICRKTFSPGDKVTMKVDQFLCHTCVSYQESNHEEIKSKNFSNRDTRDTNDELSPDDVITDQGYISADPTSFSVPTPNSNESQPAVPIPNLRDQRTKSRSSLSRSLFEFGKFYRSSYLDIQETRDKERQAQSKQCSTRPNNFHLPLSNTNDRSAILTGIGTPLSPPLDKLTSASTSDVTDKENVIRLSSYPAGEKPLDNIPVAMERDDWPAPLSTALLVREKGLRNVMEDAVVDYTQSLNYLVSDLHDMGQRNLIEVLKGSPKHVTYQKSQDNVISESRSPNANRDLASKTRFYNHKDKSRSRDTSYFDDAQRHNGYSLEFISSTTRPFMAGRIPHATKPRGILQDLRSETSLQSRNLSTNNNNKHGKANNYRWAGGRTMSSVLDSHLKPTEYDSILEEPVFEDGLSSSDIDLVTGLKKTKKPCWADKINQPMLMSDRNSINSKIQSLETLSFPSLTSATKSANSVLAYSTLVSRDPHIIKRLDTNRLEIYLSTAEFQCVFKLNRADFYRLPEWKQNDLKRRVHLF